MNHRAMCCGDTVDLGGAGRSFAIVGGETSGGESASVVRYDADAEAWEVVEGARLATPRKYAVAMELPERFGQGCTFLK